jgi:glycyl-tRNA synthetase beta chain
MGFKTSAQTYGHRFLYPKPILLKDAKNYTAQLFNPGKVIANYAERRANIHSQLVKMNTENRVINIDDDLLDEVTGLVEWPVALAATFDPRFLETPKEALISAMKTHQKSFSVRDQNYSLLPQFVTIANIESKQPQRVIAGNERVMRARLSDALFFYHTDLKHTLESRVEKLKNIIFQTKLGTLYDKITRLTSLSCYLAEQIGADIPTAERAALLAKSDLVSEMVGEFPELQGIMGYYYAVADGESESVATAIKEHYLPRFAGDELPVTPHGCTLAIADRMDTIVGIFGINQAPTGDKDPFAVRRAALGVLRIIIEKRLMIDLKSLIEFAKKNYSNNFNNDVSEKIFDFMMERLRAYYAEQKITPDVFAAVTIRQPTKPLDLHQRILAIQHFKTLPEAQALTAANKRVSNILKKENLVATFSKINPVLFEKKEEHILADLLLKKNKEIEELCARGKYTQALSALAVLQKPIDQFFDNVMVMVEDSKLRENRLALLVNLRNLFLEIADISLLQI